MEAKKRESTNLEEKTTILELEERVDELERDNRALAFELKEALRDADVLRANQNEQKPTLEGEEMFLETRLANLEDRMEVREVQIQRGNKNSFVRASRGSKEIGVTPRNGCHHCKTSPLPISHTIQHCSQISDKGHQMGRYLTPLQIFGDFTK